MLLRLTKQFTFEMAHALPAYEGKCRNIHGHSYKLFVTVEGTPLRQQGAPTDGMVMDFSAIKRVVEERIVSLFDHALVLPRLEGKPLDGEESLGGFAARIIPVDFQPTTENLLLHFARLLDGQLPAGARLHSLKLYETETSCAELVL